jgi:hypothetical protein
LIHFRVKVAIFAESIKGRLRRLLRFATPLNDLLAGVVLGLAAYVCVQIAPAYVKNYELAATARREARLAAVNFKSNEAIQGNIYDKARELGLPVEIEQIRVASVVTESAPDALASLTGPDAAPQSSAKADLDIEVSYSVPVEFPGWTFHLNFHLHADDHSA